MWMWMIVSLKGFGDTREFIIENLELRIERETPPVSPSRRGIKKRG